MKSKLIFLSNFLKNPKEVASITPSSKHVIKSITDNINFDDANCIVEYGPGIGNITGAILRKLKPNAKLISFETNRKFCNFIKDKIKDCRLEIINDSAQKLDFYLKKCKVNKVDYAVSGIPFSLITTEEKKSIVQKTRDSLKDGGKFIVYQNCNHMKKYLSMYFKKISAKIEFRNIPPTFIYICEKT